MCEATDCGSRCIGLVGQGRLLAVCAGQRVLRVVRDASEHVQRLELRPLEAPTVAARGIESLLDSIFANSSSRSEISVEPRLPAQNLRTGGGNPKERVDGATPTGLEVLKFSKYFELASKGRRRWFARRGR